jgi:hypothetical protein
MVTVRRHAQAGSTAAMLSAQVHPQLHVTRARARPDRVPAGIAHKRTILRK